MNHILLLAYPAALLIFTCFHARLTRGGRVSDGFLSLEQTHMIQAFACIGVILHHVTQQITAYGIYDKGPISLFNDIGILFTALFFFFSGYGLISRYADFSNDINMQHIPKITPACARQSSACHNTCAKI